MAAFAQASVLPEATPVGALAAQRSPRFFRGSTGLELSEAGYKPVGHRSKAGMN